MKNTIRRILLALILAPFVIPIHAQVVLDFVQTGSVGYECYVVASDGQEQVISRHVQERKALASCQLAKLQDLAGEYRVRHTGYIRIVLNSDAQAQFGGADRLTVTSLTAGNEQSLWTDQYGIDENPVPGNYVYADVVGAWQPGDIFAPQQGSVVIHTRDADKGSTGSSLFSFTTNQETQICVWVSDGIITKASWLATNSFVDSGHNIALPDGPASGYCAIKASGSQTMGGNTPAGDTSNGMYVVSVTAGWRRVPPVNIPPPDENGFIVFASDAGAMNESTTDATLIQFRRILSSDGAVSVDVRDSGAGSCTSGVEYNAITTTTFNWADTELGNQYLSITANAASANCTVVMDFTNLTGGIAAYTERQTMTITINDLGATPEGNLFVSDAGSDANDCTSGTPCLTFQRAHDVALPADVIELQKNGTGTRTYTQCTNITRDGTAGNVIRVFVRSGDTYNFYPSSGCDAIIDFDNAQYWHLDGSVGTMRLGDQSEWLQSEAGQGFPQDLSIWGHNGSNNIELEGFIVRGGGLYQGACNLIDESTTLFNIHETDWGYCGTNNDVIPGPNFGKDRGDLLTLAGALHKFENNRLGPGGHTTISHYAKTSVFRGNTFDGGVTGTGFPGTNAASFTPGSDLNRGIAPYGPNLYERNIFINGGDSADQTNQGISKISGYRQIFRQNLACNNDGIGYKLNNNTGGFSAHHTVESGRFYNNTTVNSGAFWDLDSGRTGSLDNMGDMVFRNNLHDNGTVQSTFGWALRWENNVSTQQGYPNDWHGAIFDNNWIHIGNGDYDVRFRAPTDETMDWFADLETNYPNVFSNNAKTRVTYVNSSLCTFAGLKISGITGTDEAEPMATVTAGSSGTTITVSDAWWIYDGFGIPGEVADYVAFYQSDQTTLVGIRQVASVTSRTSFTITSAITLSSGYVVYPVEADATTVVRDMGASQ